MEVCGREHERERSEREHPLTVMLNMGLASLASEPGRGFKLRLDEEGTICSSSDLDAG